MNSILLVGAALVGLPVLLHLIMKQEPKRLPFAAFRFLKQTHRTNRRKMRLRHFLLLALRVLIIALFCLALYQPSLLSEGLNIRGERPIAVVLIVDATPSMGYVANDRTRLDEARRRALELLDDLPDGSKVAVLDTTEPGGEWLPSAADARARLHALERPSGASRPLAPSLGAAYRLLRTVDQESESAEPLQRLVAVFTDRAAACWDAARTEDLKKDRDAVPDPKPIHAVVDVGADNPADVAVVSAEVSPQVVPGNVPAVVAVTVAAVGPDVEVGVRCRLDGAPAPERKAVPVPGGQSRGLTFEFRELKPGLHQVEVGLETPDKLPYDNARFLTFRVAEPRKILTVSDDPKDAEYWKLAHEVRNDFACETAAPERAVALDWRAYEVVCLLSVADPNRPTDAPLWAKALKYVRGGGKLIVMPGGDDAIVLDAYDPTKPTADNAANLLMPGTLKRPVEVRDGAAWAIDDRVLQHPMLAPIREWQKLRPLDILKNPRKARKFWEVEPLPGSSVVVRYDDDPDPAKRHPAVLERNVGAGRVVLLTTRMDVPWDREREWNDYWQTAGSSWYVVFPYLLVRSLAGDAAEANFNYLTGQTAAIRLPPGGAGPGGAFVLEGPGLVTKDDTYLRPTEKQTELRIGPPRTSTPGNFTLSVEEKDAAGATRLRPFDGYSLNVPAEEATLDKAPVEAIEELTGKNSVLPVDKNLKLRDAIEGKFTQPIELFPWLLIAVLVLLATEGLVANRFYRSRK